MVVDTTLAVTLSADPMEIEAGGTTMITATANRAVTAGDGAVTINLTVWVTACWMPIRSRSRWAI